VALILLLAAFVVLLAPALWHGRDRQASLARNRAYAAFGADFLDAVQGLATLKAFGQSGARARALQHRAHELFRSTMWVLGSNTMARGITDTGIALGAALALTLGAWRVSTGAMSVPALLVILMLGVEVFRPLRELRILLHQGMLGTSAARGIFALLDAVPAVADRAAGPEPADAGVAFEGVTFAYPGARRPAHVELSFVVRPGERVAIVRQASPVTGPTPPSAPTSSTPSRAWRPSRRSARAAPGAARSSSAPTSSSAAPCGYSAATRWRAGSPTRASHSGPRWP